MRPLIFLVSFLFIHSLVLSQNASIEGTVSDSASQLIPYTTISLMNAADSSLVKTDLCDESGMFRFAVKPGDYFLAAYFSGYKKYTSGHFTLQADEKKTFPIAMQRSSKDLKEVEVTVQKPFIEHFADKTVVNVENSIVSTGNSVYDVLERSPGVSIDQEGNISLKGKQGVNVMIDGKPVQMSAEQLAGYLKGMPASTVEKIELITNPSSKYDAAGTAGIIDIKTKKGRKDGFNASVYGVYGQGIYEKLSAGMSFNFKKKKFNWFGNYDYGRKRDFYDLELDRIFYTHDTPVTRYSQHNFVMFPFNMHNAKLGCDIYAAKNTTLGFVAGGNSNHFSSPGYSNSETLDGSDALQYYFNTDNDAVEARDNVYANLNFKHTFDTLGREIKADVDYVSYSNPIKQNFRNTYTDPAGNEFLPPTAIRTSVKASLQIYSAKVDYVNPFSKSAKMEAGLKSSYVTADNDKVFYNTNNGVETLDTGKTNHFLYEENINAAYLNFSKDWDKFSIQFGLRGEQTLVQGNQVTSHVTFSRSYAQLFPSAFALYKLNEKNNISLSYSRRISRPNYQSLNPFILYVDPTFYKQGNPYLEPELSDNIELSYTFNDNLSITPYYSYASRNISAVLLQDDVNKITIQTEQNMDHVDYYGLSMNVTLKPFKWWNSFNNIDLYKGTYAGSQQGEQYVRSNTVFSINTTNSFILGKTLSAELSFFYKTREVYSVLDINPSSSLNIGIKKSFPEKKLSAKLSGTDLLYMNNTSGAIKFSSINEKFSRHRDTRVVSLSLTWIIGKGGSSASAKRQSGAEEEKRRAASGGG
ncbi:MAG: TonB-dependent receptor [Bacteroidetes bacterium]|nr:TonB-dependent receptor [Bacteroidota bacterium]